MLNAPGGENMRGAINGYLLKRVLFVISNFYKLVDVMYNNCPAFCF